MEVVVGVGSYGRGYSVGGGYGFGGLAPEMSVGIVGSGKLLEGERVEVVGSVGWGLVWGWAVRVVGDDVGRVVEDG